MKRSEHQRKRPRRKAEGSYGNDRAIVSPDARTLFNHFGIKRKRDVFAVKSPWPHYLILMIAI